MPISLPPKSASPMALRRRRHPGGLEDLQRRARGSPARPYADVVLRLSIAREGVGLELARPARLECLRVTSLVTTFPGMRFPVEISGGVARFRHRQGRLDRIEAGLDVQALERWASARLRQVAWPEAPDVWVSAEPAKAVVCVSPARTTIDEDRAPVVAFDLHAMADGDDLVLVVSDARGLDLPATPTAIAVACVEAALGGVAARAGTTFTIRRFAGAITGALMPEAGARVPTSRSVPCSAIVAEGGGWFLQAERDGLPAAPRETALRAREGASIAAEGDELLVGGDAEAARASYLAALERAPRHPEIVRRIAEIDAWTAGRAEAALAMLAELPADAAVRLGPTRAALFHEKGDDDGAVAAAVRAAEAEPAPTLAGRTLEHAASWTVDPEMSADLLDRALARAPRSTSARWARAAARLALGRLTDAEADVEHLEALARRPEDKHAVWMRAGRAWNDAGLRAQAAVLFERALRFVPNDPEAMAGLAASLLDQGAAPRAVVLFRNALEAAGDAEPLASSVRLALARTLAERLDELPASIALVVAVGADSPSAAQARGLEGRWRARLGDGVGASLAFARLRDLASSLPAAASSPPHSRPGDRPEVVELLREAAQWELAERRDSLAAQRHLAAALRLAPHDAAARNEYRAVGAQILRAHDAGRPPLPGAPRLSDTATTDAPRTSNTAVADAVQDAAIDSEMGDIAAGAGVSSAPRIAFEAADEAPADVERAARIEDLSRRLQANPNDDAIADELTTLLEEAERGHELLALLSARLEDAAPARRGGLVPRMRAVLERLATAADAASRREEAALYRSVASGLDGL